MLPKYHIILGLAFSLILFYIFPQIDILAASIIFLASVLIDVDHYINFVLIKKDLSLNNAYSYFKEGIRKKVLVHRAKLKVRPQIFHTLEFLLVLGILSFFSKYFLFIFIGFIFHSLLDVIEMGLKGVLYAREFSIISWIKNKNTKKYL